MAHYALSEILIVLAGSWTIIQLNADGRKAACIGIGLFTLAAALGVVRFGLSGIVDGLIDILAVPHRLAGTLGGTAGLAALVYEAYTRGTSGPLGFPLRTISGCALALVLAFAYPALAVPFFLAYMLAFIFMAARYANALGHQPLVTVAISALMLVNVLVFRQASWLSPAMSWHVFHILVAIWLVGLGWLFRESPTKQAAI